MAQFFPEQLVALCDMLAAVLAHSLWQGLLISVAVWIVLRTVPTRYSNLRYATALGGLATVVLAAFVTWTVLQLPSATVNQPTASTASLSTETRANVVATAGTPPDANSHLDSALAVALEPTGSPTGTNRKTPEISHSAWLRRLAPTIITFWLVGVCLMLVRTTGAVVRWQRWMAREVRVSPLDLSELESLVAELSARLKLRQVVRLVVCDQVSVPAVLGMLWPTILIPPAMLTGIPAEQWRIILAHELAHVRRYDNLVNLVQMLIESLFFFNPAVWWISRQVRVEREASCDALAAEVAGKPVSVARTLIDVARSLREGSMTVPLPMTALAEPRHGGLLTDRVRRLLHPNTASRPKLTGSGLFLALLVVVATGAALQQGTDLAVRTAAELMSPKERVDTLARLQAEQGAVFVASGSSTEMDEPATDQGAADTAEPGEESRKIKVTVNVRTEDGAPVPADVLVHGFYRTGDTSGHATVGYSGREVPQFSASHSFPPCQLIVAAWATGYAATISELPTLFIKDGDREIELVLAKGFTTRLRMIDEEGEAVPGAWVRASPTVSSRSGGRATFNQRDFTSDADGIVVIDHATSCQYHLEAQVGGFQRADQRLTLSPDQTVDWLLSTARPTAVRVVDTAGDPVPEAKLVIFSWKKGHHENSFNDPRSRTSHAWNLFAETDDDGRAVLSELCDDRVYCFGVLAPGFGLRFLEDVTGGEEEQIVTLKPPLRVTGRLTGALDRLHTRKREGRSVRRFTYRNVLKFDDSVHSDLFYANVDEAGRFDLPNLVPGTVRLELPGGVKRLDVQKSLLDLEFAIPETDPPEAPTEMREVVVRLMGTSPDAPARGNMLVSGQRLGRFVPGEVPIVDNEVRVNVPVSAKLRIVPRDVVGYTFDEQQDVEVVTGDGPQIVELPTRPAGAVHGRIFRPDGSAADSASLHAFAIELPDGLDERTNFNESSSSGSAFFRSLPLGGRYQVVAREFTDSAVRWVVSDVFTLDKSHPIEKLDLHLPKGRTVTVRVVDSAGQPVPGVPVQIECTFRSSDWSSSTMTFIRATGRDGIARLENTVTNGETGSLTRSMYAVIASLPGYVGWQGKLADLPSSSLADREIRLAPGVSASGVLLDRATGRPIPRAEIRLSPVERDKATFLGRIQTTTNERGEFRFDSLEQIEYRGRIEGAVSKGTQFTSTPGGGARFTDPGGGIEHGLRGGSSKPVKWQVTIRPDGPLKPLPAE